ncbi:MAG: TonB-dependent receptor [Bacteroides sp.]|uniref:SusC/RagA family TonB-linked outer membrane protein n=1 Tax=Bacteroides sp. TaxID=29523 RepID=UPI002FCA1E64
MSKRTKTVGLIFMSFALSFPGSVFAETTHGSFVADITQQQTAITGTVTDDAGEPIIGASIVIKGAQTGTITDLDGNFKLNAPKGATLIISYIGYISQEVAVTGKVIHIKLQENTKQLDEVVIVGFGTQKKVNLTGAVGTVSDEVLQSRPVTNATQALQGVLPGLNITMNSAGGELNNGMNINIRGAGTIGSGSKSSPLILIDGMDGDINALNPQDIENVTVLKDAAAASVYGSRASFGVILVTTKKGKAGKPNVAYNASFRLSSPTRMAEMMDSYSFANYYNLASTNANQGVVFDKETMDRIVAFQKGEITTQSIPDKNNSNLYNAWEYGNNNVDWLKEHYKSNAFAHEQNVSINGGSESVQYYISGNYLDQNGLLRYGDDNFQRYAFSTKINAKLADWASINVSTKFTRADTDQPQFLTDNSRLFYQGLSRTWPTVPGNYEHGGNTYATYIPALRDGGRAKTQDDYLYQQLQLVLEPIKNWKIFAEGNYRTRNLFVHNEVLPIKEVGIDGVNFNVMPVGSYATGLSRVTEKGYRENFFNTNLYTEYGQTINDTHTYKAMIGFNAELNKDRGIQAYRDGLITPFLPTINTATGADKITDGSYNHWATAGFFGRVNYDYKGRYLLEANLRYDGTSRFLSEERWNWFPSLSGGWNITHEPFMESLSKEVSLLKVRASYGTLGNQNTESLYPFYSLMKITANGSNWLLNGTNPNKIEAAPLISKYLTWEKVESWNIGLDFGFFNNRLSGSFDWFNRYTRNMVGPAPELPLTLGTSVPKMNNADLKTAGWELSIGWRDRLKNGLSYGVRFTVADARSKVMKYPNESNNILNYDNGTKIYHVGQYLGEIWGYTTLGIAKTNDEMNAHLSKVNQNALGSEWAAGDIMYADLNGDGEINGGKSVLGDMGDKKIIGNDTPRYNFGLTLDGDWKGFDCSVFFQGTMKRDLWLGSPQLFGATSKWHGMGLKAHEDYFRLADDPMGENLNAYYARPIFDNAKNQQIQTRYLQSGAYIRLKNVQLGYTLPLILSQKAAMQKLRLFVSAENLWTGTSLSKAFDPESFSGDQGAGRSYPLQTTISFGLSVNF